MEGTSKVFGGAEEFALEEGLSVHADGDGLVEVNEFVVEVEG